ncbi:MAG: hypothetical protein WAN30_06800 [Acidimicrobiales bacterium]
MIGATVSSGVAILVVAVFLASCVEMVEALTIVIAVGHTRGWRSSFEGVAAALAALTVLVLAVGPALVRVPLATLHLVIGAILLIFGMQWLRKAILRSSGLKEKGDEDVRYQKTVALLEQSDQASSRDHVAFVIAFKGVFLEGLEVVITVITLGTSSHRLGLAALVAVVAVLLVAAVGVVVSKQLTKVPENAMKMGVGIMLTSYGTFWAGEGLKVRWPGGDVELLVLVGVYLLATWSLIAVLRRSQRTLAAAS